jgi:hypothetical protein
MLGRPVHAIIRAQILSFTSSPTGKLKRSVGATEAAILQSKAALTRCRRFIGRAWLGRYCPMKIKVETGPQLSVRILCPPSWRFFPPIDNALYLSLHLIQLV